LNNHGGATATDACGDSPTAGSNLTWTHNSSGLSDLCGATGAETVTFRVTDGSGNYAETTATFTIQDTTDPTAVAQNVIVTLDANGNGTTTAAAVNNGSSDVCGSVALALSKTAFTCADLGSNTVTLTVTDDCGNDATATATVTVQDTTNPTITAPADVQFNTDNASCAVLASGVSLGSATAADNCTYTVTNDAPASFPLGNTTVTWTITDSSNNTATDTQIVTVVDNQAPTISGVPADITQSAAAGLCNAVVTWTDATTADNCSATMTQSHDSGDTFSLGETTVTYTSVDAAGNTTTATFKVTITDDEDPVLTTSASDESHEYDGSDKTALLNAWLDSNGGAMATDNCTTLTWTNNYTALTTGCGITESALVTFTATDGSGNTVSTSATWSIVDTTAPTVAFQGINLTAECNPGTSPVSLWLDNAAYSNVTDASGITWTNDYTGMTNGCGITGNTSVTFTATDACGNQSTITRSLTIEDSTDPSVMTQNVTVILDADGNASITTDDIDNGSYDNCGDITLALDITSFTCDDLGNNTVTLTATDLCSNAASATATVTVVDNISPVALAQDVTVQLDASGNGSTTAAAVDNGSSDICGVTLALSKTAFTCSDVGENVVTLTVTDPAGNATTATATVTVEDNVAPVAAAQNVTVTLDASGNGSTTAASVDNGSTDACGVTLSLSKTDFTCSDVGANPVVLTVTDPSGNQTTANATVTVQDTTAPNAVAQNVTIQLDSDGNAATTAAAVNNNSSDACGIASMTLSKSAFTCADLGDNVVTLTVTDNNGNSSTATATVTVEDNVDPVITLAAANSTVECDGSGNVTAFNAWLNNHGGATATDACGPLTWTHNSTGLSDLCGATGAETVTFTVTDGSGNFATTSATFTIEDTTAPTALTQDITIQLDASGAATITAAQVDNTSVDACGGVSLSVSQTAFNCTHVGPNTVTLTVEDDCGNTSTETAVVTVQDVTAPTAVAQNITIQLDSDGNASTTAAAVDNGSADACGVTLSLSQTAFDCSDLGDNTVTLTVTDPSNNQTTTTATVTVEDNVDPVITLAAANSTVECDGSGNVAAFNAWLSNHGGSTATDACGPLTWTHNSTGLSDLCGETGAETVTFTVTDGSGNFATTSATFTIEDTTAPTALTQDITIQLDASGAATITAAQVDNTSVDACGGVSLSVSQTAFDCTHVGTNTVTLTVEDDCGNTSTETAVVTVQDVTDPTAVAQNITIQLDSDGNASTMAEAVDNGSWDACGVTLLLSQTAFTCSDTSNKKIKQNEAQNN
jgi:hypothetical protein